MLQINVAGFEGEPLEDSFVGELFGRLLPDALCAMMPLAEMLGFELDAFAMHGCTNRV